MTPKSLDAHDTEQIRETLERARRIQLVCHVDPDGDAIGSLLGLGWLLQAQGKELTLTCQDPVPEPFRWLPGSDQIRQRNAELPELIISVDCSDLGRLGDVFPLTGNVGAGASLRSAFEDSHAPPPHWERSIPLVNIDHHITDTHFGTINWVDPTSVATSQMVLTLAETLGWLPPARGDRGGKAESQGNLYEAATCLLTGIVTDTRGFRTVNVDAAALQAALRLMEFGAPLSEIAHLTLDLRSFASLRLWGQALGRLQLQEGILWTEISWAESQQWSPGEDGSTGLANFLVGVREAHIVAVLRERQNGTVDVGLRAARGYDVAQAAFRLGGGGHPQAAGCTLSGTLDQVRERVLAELRRSLADSGLPIVDRNHKP